jgi:diguanylate cyclase (GGDEF)-like protein
MEFYYLLLSDCILALILLGLFVYVGRVARRVKGIVSWGVGHYLYSLGAAMVDGSSSAGEELGSGPFLYFITSAGSATACAGTAIMAGAMVKFVGRRPLHLHERLALCALMGLPMAAGLAADPLEAQAAAMTASSLVLLGVMLFQLRRLDSPPWRVPARLMMAGALVLFLVYGNDLLDALDQSYAGEDAWLNVDLATWFLFNFCMLMLASFRAAEALQLRAMQDPLTGTLNRRGLHQLLDTRLQQLGTGQPVAVIGLDLDHFKAINDGWGHDTGDRVLQQATAVVRGCLREDDLFARMGGEEFLVVLCGSAALHAAALAERLRLAIQAMPLPSPGPDRVTASFGVSVARHGGALTELQRLADQALYSAKREGRNRVVQAPGPDQPAT